MTPGELSVLYRDDHLVAINKPAGLLVHRGWARDRVTALALVRDLVGKHVHPVHRLDRATSGVLLFALDPDTTRLVQAQFAEGQVVKNYLLLCRGPLAQGGLIDHALRKSKEHERRPACTAVRPLGSFERYSLVEARPYTGRQHQVRRHLKHISAPLIGDTRYGKGEHNRRFRQDFELHRLCLHASKTRLLHPYEGHELLLRAPLPDDLLQPFSLIGLADAAQRSIQAPCWAPSTESLLVLAHDDQAGEA